jgi:hypothetical protein
MTRGWWEEASTWNDQRMVGKGLYLECPEVYWEKVFTWNDQRFTGKRSIPGMTRGLLGKGLYLE